MLVIQTSSCSLSAGSDIGLERDGEATAAPSRDLGSFLLLSTDPLTPVLSMFVPHFLTRMPGESHCSAACRPAGAGLPWANPPMHAGYGFCRRHIQMFDPGFAGYRARGKEDAGAADGGADPLGVLDRFGLGGAGSRVWGQCSSAG